MRNHNTETVNCQCYNCGKRSTRVYNFTIKIIIPTNQSFLTTLRTKLLWGEDTRNGSNI